MPSRGERERAARSLEPTESDDERTRGVGESVGFVPARNEPKASCGVPEASVDAKTERSEGLAERVGFEPCQPL